ncbi:hypothetical protein [Paracoccus sediminicola]|uniref:hypothetical protein n=1 Tax=Paracoccus sediminicola TaxID=3017783 RepID=UPI0022F08EDF|nr:hypothetical protein [Paracoccus sediminicola]WBU55883.1 hypothetical protein PAF18_10265 [Paracoccus sediminicola]
MRAPAHFFAGVVNRRFTFFLQTSPRANERRSRMTSPLPLLAAAMPLLLAACADVNDTPVSSTPTQMTGDDRSFLQSSITDQLKDPDAALFRNLRVYELSGGQGRVLCGELNGKNSFGAYVGYEPFVMRIKDGQVVSQYVGTGEEVSATGLRAKQGCEQAATGEMKIKADLG